MEFEFNPRLKRKITSNHMKTLIAISRLSHRLPLLNLNDLMIRQPWHTCRDESIYAFGTWENYHVNVHVLACTSPNYAKRIAGIYTTIEAINTVGIDLISDDKQRTDSLLLKAPLWLFEIEHNGNTYIAYFSLSAVPPPDPGSGPPGQYLYGLIPKSIAGFLSLAG